MDLIEIDELEDRINQLKKELIQIAEETGLNSDDTIRLQSEVRRVSS